MRHLEILTRTLAPRPNQIQIKASQDIAVSLEVERGARKVLVVKETTAVKVAAVTTMTILPNKTLTIAILKKYLDFEKLMKAR